MLQSITYHTFLEAIGVFVIGWMGYVVVSIPLAAAEVRRNSGQNKKAVEDFFTEREDRKTTP